MSLAIEAATRTHIGRVRRRNEDAAFAGQWLFAVADGLGGHVAGDMASSTVISALKAHDRLVDPADLSKALGSGVRDANEALRRRIADAPELAGMGTTLVALLWSGSTVALANIGDSRAYLLRSNETVQITEDHVYGNLVADAPHVPSLAERLTRFIDGRADGRSPDLNALALQPQDRLLLCSDGLSTVVPPESVHDVLVSTRAPADAAEQLVESALDHGGPDNVTVLVIDVREALQAATFLT